MRLRTGRIATYLVLFAALPGTEARAQTATIVVSVADAATGAPLASAQVRVPKLGRLARVDWLGEARIPGVSDGRYTLEGRAMGYAPSDIELDVSGDSVGAG